MNKLSAVLIQQCTFFSYAVILFWN